MTAAAERLAKEVLALPDDDRSALVDILLRSVKVVAQEEMDRLWAEEAERRVLEIEDGKLALLDGEEVFREIRQRLGR